MIGGSVFTEHLVSYVADRLRHKTNKDVYANPNALFALRCVCEEAKCALSRSKTTVLRVENIMGDGANLQETVTRAQFVKLNADLFQRTLTMATSAPQDSKFNKDMIDDVVLVGGSTRIPKIRSLLADYFGRKAGTPLSRGGGAGTRRSRGRLHPHQTIAQGPANKAAIRAQVPGSVALSGRIEDLLLLQVTPMTLASAAMTAS
jgi:L1 cell adhesion molecule like protein